MRSAPVTKEHPQGDYAFMQCEAPCWRETWDIKPIIDRILPTIDPETQEITDPSVIPICPNCGGPVFMNVRAAHWFIDDPYRQQAERFVEYVQDKKESRLLLIEIGAGFNTPQCDPLAHGTYRPLASKCQFCPRQPTMAPGSR